MFHFNNAANLMQAFGCNQTACRQSRGNALQPPHPHLPRDKSRQDRKSYNKPEWIAMIKKNQEGKRRNQHTQPLLEVKRVMEESLKQVVAGLKPGA
jgi:hypothetical protein